jgi:hypothetical protein
MAVILVNERKRNSNDQLNINWFNVFKNIYFIPGIRDTFTTFYFANSISGEKTAPGPLFASFSLFFS